MENHAKASSTIPENGDTVVGWSGPKDPENPFNWKTSKRWRVSILVCFMTFAVQINGTAMTSAAEVINEDFHITDEHFPHSYWPVLSWNLGGAAAPMLGLPLMESFGIRWSYLSIYLILIIFLIPQFLAQNFATLIITRIFTGGCTGVLANITSGVVSDIWRPGRSKSFSTSLWIFSLLAGLSLGPVFGSLTVRFASWRWIFLSEVIAYAIFLPFILFLLPETRPDVLLTQRARRIRRETGKTVYASAEKTHLTFKEVIRETLIRPSRMLVTEPVVLFFGLWSAFCIGTAFMFTQSIVQVYSGLYSWTYYGTGFVQAAIVVGELIGLTFSVIQDHLYFTSANRNRETPGSPIPEARLYLSIPASFLGLTAGLFIYAWTSYTTIHWIFPTIGLAFVGFGMSIIISAVSLYLLDMYGKFSASAIAGVAFLENALAAFLPLATQDMYRSLGFNWASSLLGFLALALSFIPVVLMIWGPSIRERSYFIKEAQYDDHEEDVVEAVA
ncbi:MFS general substrate transporter [Aaosphaeria arxii CBS 175.79]|uniref:MFS general substrate transporter n=1 Tax=Aaosphaeria arxii CBS 175.79 TaxID=1450172 RepID=A0A6A5X812_9PLEO|nr:MFS general substrate transporter [Aaosphaeria arxii CBS 175.79]KAF2009088.1 MFS general substrate transporter [Aaosphaeria arxii CBS 175.79]